MKPITALNSQLSLSTFRNMILTSGYIALVAVAAGAVPQKTNEAPSFKIADTCNMTDMAAKKNLSTALDKKSQDPILKLQTHNPKGGIICEF